MDKTADVEINDLSELQQVLLRGTFSEVRVLFFDLDGTLHDFKKTASIAMEAVYKEIVETYDLNKKHLQEKYIKIIKSIEKEAFVDGKNSFEYRKERFTKLLGSFSIEDDSFIEKIVCLYGEVFEANLRLENNALKTLRHLSTRYNMYLITEGPLDAQIRTVKKIKIERFFKKIFTSGEYGEIKETGKLFSTAKNELQIQTREIVVIGDSVSKDIRGAHLSGIKSILVKTFIS